MSDDALSILVVDDDRDFAESFADLLEMDGHRVRPTHVLKDALRAVDEARFDIAFVDLRLGGHDGLEVIARLREVHPPTLLVVMSGVDRRAAPLPEGTTFLGKPTDWKEVELQLEAAREHRRTG